MKPVQVLVVAVSLGAALAAAGRVAVTVPVPAQAGPRFVTRPLAFEENRGQTNESVKFLARGGPCTAFLTPTETVLPVNGGALRIRPADANAAPQVEGLDELPGKANYFLGNDPAKWRTNVPTFARVRARDVYPGIDVVSYGTDGRLEYDFVVAPGVDPSVIAIEFDGADRVELGARGELALHVGGETIRQLKPVVYQDVGGSRREVAGGYVMDGPDRVRFVVGAYDAAHPLCIDPTIVYGSYLGGNDFDSARRIVRDTAGNLYVCGVTRSTDFPKADAGQVDSVGIGPIASGADAAFVTKLDPTGTSVIFATYVGGNSTDFAYGARVDGAGNVFVCGQASSSDFPTTPGVIQTVKRGIFDAFLLGLSPDGSALLFSTYLGGSGNDRAIALAMDGAGNFYITGECTSGFPTQDSDEPYQSPLGYADAFVAKINPTGTTVRYHKGLAGTVVGGDGEGTSRGDGIAVDAAGNAYVAGSTETSDFPLANAYQTTYAGGSHDAFVACVNPSGSDLVFSTFLGGSGDDVATALTLAPGGHVLVAGMTYSGDLPYLDALQPSLGGSTDMFVAEFTATGTAVHVTNFGGTGNEFAQAEAGDIVVDGAGKVWITAFTVGGQLPTTVGAAMPTPPGDSDGFVARFDAALSTIEYCTYLGGLDDDYATSLVVADSGNPFVVGFTISTDFPTTSGALHTSYGGNEDAFIISPPVLLAPPPPPPPAAIEAFFLPKRVVATQNAKTPSKSKLIAAGFFDLGPDEPDLTKPATLDVGGFSFSIPGLALKGKKYYYAEPGMDFTVFTDPARSSRARFRVRTTGDLTGKVELNGPLTLKFTSGDVKDAKGVVKLTAGRYALGKVKGSLVTPSLFVQRAAANLKAAGKHSLSITVGLATGGTTPPAAADLTIGFGGNVAATIPAASFVRKGNTDVFTGNIHGVTKVVLNYARDQISVTGKGLDLGSYAQGGNAVLIALALGADQHAVHVRMGRTGNLMKY